MIRTTTLRPGLLVSLKTSIDGNVDYVKRIIEEEHITESGQMKGVWETERTVIDPAEHKEAIEVRSKARSLLTSVCTRSEFGLLCPEDKQPKLEEAIAKAKQLCEDFNQTSAYTTISFYTITGRIAADDAEAIRAINFEVRGLLDQMKSGIDKLDVDAVREAASKAKQLGSMLSPAAQERLEKAVKSIRGMATRMVKAGEQAATEIDEATLRQLAEARTAFLDIDDAAEVAAPEDTTARGIDLAPHEEIAAPVEQAAEIDVNDLL